MRSTTSLFFRGWQAGLEIDEALSPGEVYSAHDHQGRRYLIAHTAASTWLCAPISERALECVVSGRAELRAVFAHTSTGIVERLTICDGFVCEDSLLCCSDLTETTLPVAGARLGLRERCA